MCTLSWLPDREGEGYTLWFNRDELHTRAAELAPRELRTAAGTLWLAPTDPDSGGTWLAVNQHGVTAALLNDYVPAWAPPSDGPRDSRGRLAPMTVEARSAREAIGAVRAAVLDRTPPFDLVAVDAAGGVSRLHWDGVTSRVTHDGRVPVPMTSSSHQPARVAALRRRAYPRCGDPAAITAYHHSHDTEAAAESVNMSRGNAATRSISRVRVGAEWIVFDYEPQNWPGTPRVSGGRQQWRLPREVAFSSARPE